MSKNPYSVLGIPDNATEEQIKTAYRELAKKYHPDNFPDQTMRELAEEKMKEINEAYDFLTRKNDGGTNNYSTSEFFKIRTLINEQRFSEAEIKLDAMNAQDRNAEWHFLKGCVVSQRGWFSDAQKFFEIACNMDPQNKEYRQAYESMRNTAYNYSQGYNQNDIPSNTSHNDGCCDTDCCTKLICLDCLCECMGGDFISCC